LAVIQRSAATKDLLLAQLQTRSSVFSHVVLVPLAPQPSGEIPPNRDFPAVEV
jgi:hypothetical protein